MAAEAPEPGTETKLPAEPLTSMFSDALRYQLKLGFTSLGSPAGQIAIMHVPLVEMRRWISEQRFCMCPTTAWCYPARRRRSSPAFG